MLIFFVIYVVIVVDGVAVIVVPVALRRDTDSATECCQTDFV